MNKQWVTRPDKIVKTNGAKLWRRTTDRWKNEQVESKNWKRKQSIDTSDQSGFFVRVRRETMHTVSADYRVLIILIPQNRDRYAGGLALAERNPSERDDYRGVNDRNVFIDLDCPETYGRSSCDRGIFFLFFFLKIRWTTSDGSDATDTHNAYVFSGRRDHYYRMRTENDGR